MTDMVESVETPGSFSRPFDDERSKPRLRTVRNKTIYERRVKRLGDVMMAAVAVVLVLPVALTIAGVIRAGLGRGVLYRQERVGLGGRPFTILKFRTMHPDRRTARGDSVSLDRRREHKTPSDPRHTGFGSWLRRWSLDEIPQLINVVRGDMSLVGPRPEVVSVAVERGYRDHIRHDVRPGLTGPYQTSSLRLSGDLRDGLAVDTAYVANLTFLGDLRYLLRTIGVLLGTSRGS